MKIVILALCAMLISLTGAFAAPVTYYTDLRGDIEVPLLPLSPATGFSRVTIDTEAHTLEIFATFSGLLGLSTAAHIHAPTADPPPLGFGQTAGVATAVPSFPDFPLGVLAGTYFRTFDLTQPSSFSPAFLNNHGGGTAAGAEMALAQYLAQGRGYLNIHSTVKPGGEIRGFYEPIPEPATVFSVAGALVAFALFRRRRHA
jgi:hypothetical protein